MSLRKIIQYRFKVYRYFKQLYVWLTWTLRLNKSRLLFRHKPKIKLVAIAKNEACYLPEWIAHHLYFGFKDIAIYVNNTTDNTANIEKKLAAFSSIEFCDGDRFFTSEINSPQVEIYRHELRRSRKQGFSHVMFLDIDEFWTPKDLNTKVHNFVENTEADVLCFEWLNRTDEAKPFLSSIQQKIEGIKGNHVKSLVSTHLLINEINPHSVLAYNATHQLADGTPFNVDKTNFAKIDRNEVNKPLKSVFILHRMYRSQEEYVALLLRGRPINNRPSNGVFKNNRRGYIPASKKVEVVFEDKYISKYTIFMRNFYANFGLDEEIELGKAFVLAKRNQVAKTILASPKEAYPLIKTVFTGVTLEDIVSALTTFKNKYNLE
ncbi:glycosyltransferase family 2 protein [Aliiglaciecola lipolytica]|uniref:Glycosyl transferase family 2 n=1 Tax=Aliiglaciecola lipolytica E3 TaxID=1127673 RepID=K6Y543_9ALTE|nr:glycosyltransferase family 2 protein [Aliiglaciecola lipolytica]GAC13352.1 hypothetical protein GLIP_0706 [Aliiglaciecola lipolytica E3]